MTLILAEITVVQSKVGKVGLSFVSVLHEAAPWGHAWQVARVLK